MILIVTKSFIHVCIIYYLVLFDYETLYWMVSGIYVLRKLCNYTSTKDMFLFNDAIG